MQMIQCCILLPIVPQQTCSVPAITGALMKQPDCGASPLCSKFNMFACSPAYFSLESSRTLFIHVQIMNLKSLSVRLWTLWILQANSTARSEVIPVKQQPLKKWTLETGALDSPAWQSLPFAANSAFDVRFILHSWWVNTSQANFSSLCRRLWRRLWSLLFTLGRLCSDSDRREMLRLSQ